MYYYTRFGQQKPERTSFPDCTKEPLASNKICDVTASPPERAAALVEVMLPGEKLENIVSQSNGSERLGLPFYNWWSKALHGVGYAPGVRFPDQAPFNAATSFPMPVLMAPTFDHELIEEVGNVIRTEARAWGNAGYSGIDFWTPNVNPFKDPRWGRGSETPGEDVLRVKRYAERTLRGLERPEKERRIVATCKHYAGNDFEDWNGTRARDVKCGSIMCAYNAVNGVPSCASPYLLQTVLREHWGWTEHNNSVTSDCEAVLDVSLNHKYAKTNAEGTALCFEAGVDTSCEYTSSSDIPGAWEQGLLKEETVDRALLRLYEGLDAESATLALIGFWADDGSKLQGGYNGRAPFLNSPADAGCAAGLDVIVARGPILLNETAHDNWTAPALAAANHADYVIYFGGFDTSLVGETLDRTHLDWAPAQAALMRRLGELGKPLIVVQLGDQLDGSKLLAADWASAILWASWPGQDGGTAVMILIRGEAAPAGRLSITMYPSNYADLVPMTDMALRPSVDENGRLLLPGRTYRWYPDAVRPFGYGLHYTKLEPSVPRFGNSTLDVQALLASCDKQHLDKCPLPALPVDVTNAGNRTSDYVVLAYVKPEVGPAPYPIKKLVGYERLRGVEAGETRRARPAWTFGDMARHDEDGNTVLYPGTYTVVIDEPERASIELRLVGDVAVLDKWPAPPPRPEAKQ
ncbi:hypothetical protein DL768_008192 [Monosporascus sp. mg162]|nr:hypothetical protein DL768_008192 [Monosporascus sp. mg162]